VAKVPVSIVSLSAAMKTITKAIVSTKVMAILKVSVAIKKLAILVKLAYTKNIKNNQKTKKILNILILLIFDLKT
jgi:hypothetical protein